MVEPELALQIRHNGLQTGLISPPDKPCLGDDEERFRPETAICHIKKIRSKSNYSAATRCGRGSASRRRPAAFAAGPRAPSARRRAAGIVVRPDVRYPQPMADQNLLNLGSSPFTLSTEC